MRDMDRNIRVLLIHFLPIIKINSIMGRKNDVNLM